MSTENQCGRPPADRDEHHSWYALSRHGTSAGVVVYRRCAACAGHRIDLERTAGVRTSAVSVPPRDRNPLGTAR